MSLKTDLKWTINGQQCIIRNIPYHKHNAEGEKFFDVDVSIKLELVARLMHQNQIPIDIDFNDIEDLTFKKQL